MNRRQILIGVFLVVVPCGLFFSFWLSGLFNESPLVIADVVAADTVRWTLERPGGDVDISENVENTFVNAEISSVFNLSLYKYSESAGDYGSQDVFRMKVNVSARTLKGFVASVYVVFNENYESSFVVWWQALYEFKLQNLSIDGYAYVFRQYGEEYLKEDEKAFARLKGVNDPEGVSFQAFAEWALCSPENRTHEMNVTLELTYFNGTAYKKLVQPVQLGTFPDDNNTPETAEEILNGKYTRKCVGGYDAKDYYKIYLTSGQKIDISVNATLGLPYYNLYLYDAESNQKASSQTNSRHKTITFVADSAGFWLIEIRSLYSDAGYGFYSMEVNS